MRILVTGASGLLGNQLVKLMRKEGHEVFAAYHTHPVADGHPIRLDLTDQKAIVETLNSCSPDVTIHAAALTDVDFCEEHPDIAMRVNCHAAGSLADACKANGAFLMYVSTDYVFDGKRGLYSESDEPHPVNIYGDTKLRGEREVSRRCDSFAIVRTSVVYGSGRMHRPNFALWILRGLSSGRKVNALCDQFTSPTLNSQLARMILEMADRRLKGVFHLAGATRLSRYEFAVRLAKRLQLDENLVIPVKTSSISWKAERPPDSSLNVDRAFQILDNKPVPVEVALDEFAAEIQNQ